MKLLTRAMPLVEAVTKLGEKTLVGSRLNTEQWAEVPLALRERAFFSAGVEDANFLATGQSKLLKGLSLEKEKVGQDKTAFVDRSSFIGDMRRLAQESGLAAPQDSGEAGGLVDLSSRRRLGLIYDVQTQSAQNFARWKADQNPIVMDAYPAQELIRVEERKEPRNWRQIWVENGGKLYGAGERMIALKNDRIWGNISRFGTPWPPFDFGSGMGVADVSREEAEGFGILEPGAEAPSAEAGFNDDLFASTHDLTDDIISALGSIFGNQIAIDADSITWTGGRA